VIGWALRWVFLCCGIVLISVGLLDRGVAVLPTPAIVESGPGARSAGSAPPPAGQSTNTIVYNADARGHVIVNAAVNGSPVRMLVDTGASLVMLTPEDAQNAGVTRGELVYSARVNAANGVARVAPIKLREIRIDQLSVYDVPAAVIENLNISLLGMSFLNRLQGYEMRDGKLTINW
jgi:aspartyl protease family protein